MVFCHEDTTLSDIIRSVLYEYETYYEEIIFDIFKDDNLNQDLTDKNIINIIGSYYQNKIRNYEKAKEYFLMAMKLNDSDAMYNLGILYEHGYKNYDEMKKYYLMAINLGNTKAMNSLAYYYYWTEQNNDEMKKYYLMAINLDDIDAMNALANYYNWTEQNNEEANKYWLMAIERECDSASLMFGTHNNLEIQHYLLRQIKSDVSKKRVESLEYNNFLGVRIFEELTAYCFNPKRLVKFCKNYNIEIDDYNDII